MPFTLAARAERRALAPFALMGAGLGLGLGAIYMVAGLDQIAADHAEAEQRQDALAVAFSPPAEASGTYDLIDPKQPAALTVPKPQRPQVAARRNDLECLTAAVYFEARGETRRGQAAVAQVVLNRVLHPAFPKTVCGVVYQGASTHSCQFSFACDGIADVEREGAAWRRARQVAIQALAGGGDADVGAATHFHAAGVAPAWGPQMLRVAQIGLHVFYRLRPPGSAPVKAAPAAAHPAQAVLASAVLSAPQPKIALLDKMPSDPTTASTPPAAPAAAPAPEAGKPEAPVAEAKPAPPAAAPEAAGRKPG